MADIPPPTDLDANKMNDTEIAAEAPLTEALFTKFGANVNGLIDRASRRTLITSVGSGTFTVPDDVDTLIVVGCGGGGGGGGGGSFGRGDGGGGSNPVQFIDSVSPGQIISYTIGSGGAGGLGSNTTNDTPGSNGGDSLWGSFVFPGGYGGSFRSSDPSRGVPNKDNLIFTPARNTFSSGELRNRFPFNITAGSPADIGGVNPIPDQGESSLYGTGGADYTGLATGIGGGGAGFGNGGDASLVQPGPAPSGGVGAGGGGGGFNVGGGTGGRGEIRVYYFSVSDAVVV